MVQEGKDACDRLKEILVTSQHYVYAYTHVCLKHFKLKNGNKKIRAHCQIGLWSFAYFSSFFPPVSLQLYLQDCCCVVSSKCLSLSGFLFHL